MEPSDPTDRDCYYADITAPEAAATRDTPRPIPRRSSNPLPSARSRRPSIRLMRMPLATQPSMSRPAAQGAINNDRPDDYFSRRRRSGSMPVRPTFQPDSMAPDDAEDGQARPSSAHGVPRPGMLRNMGTSARSMLNRGRSWVAENPFADQHQPDEYRNDAVDLLDVVDPEVSTLTTLTNVQNSLFVPDLGRFVNRRPMYQFAVHPAAPGIPEAEERRSESISRATSESKEESSSDKREDEEDLIQPVLERTHTNSTVRSSLSESRFAVLPEGITLDGWTAAEKRELNDHVRHMLHSRRSKFKRGMKGFWKYVRKPMGFLVTLYATLITLFGLAWVLFLIGWINVGGKQLYVINVIDNVLVALFAIVGDGLAPFRAVDTYRMIFLARYHFLTWKKRREANLPKLKNKNELPRSLPIGDEMKDLDLEGQHTPEDGQEEYSVLKPKQQARFLHHAKKFAKSHTFYKPHETTTHHAFPIRLLIAIVILLDFHSLFQIALGSVTWGINYRVRPAALTIVILCCSIVCNCTAGILILVGDRMTRKKDVVEKMFRQELTEEAIAKLEKRKDDPKPESKSEMKKRKKRQARENRRAMKRQQQALRIESTDLERHNTSPKTPDTISGDILDPSLSRQSQGTTTIKTPKSSIELADRFPSLGQ